MNVKRICRLLAVCLGLTGGVVAAVPANAANPTQPTASNRAGTIEEIVVTARKVEESLMDAPLSVTAFTADDLRESNITRLTDLDQAVPNVKMDKTADPTGKDIRIHIRGIGQNDTVSTADPGVAIFVDGVYLPRMQGSDLQLADVERVEVLRGPQGALFGKNTIGGAVNVVTKKPGPDFSAQMSANAGSFGEFGGTVSVNLPLVEDRLYSRFSVLSQNGDGWAKDTSPLGGSTDFNSTDIFGGSAALRWLPVDNLTVDLAYNRSLDRGSSNNNQCVWLGGQDLTDWFDLAAGTPGAYQEACERSARRKNGQDMKNRSDLHVTGGSGTITWDINEQNSLKYIVGWREWGQRRNVDQDATELHAITFFQNDEYESIQHEIQWSGAAMEGRLSWVAGLYYGKDKSFIPTGKGSLGLVIPEFFTDTETMIARAATWAADGVPFNGNSGWGTAAFLLQIGAITDLGTYIVNGTNHAEATALYGQLSFDVTERLHLTAGLRRSDEKKDSSSLSFTSFTGILTADTFSELHFNKLSPSVSLSFDLTEDALVYASWSEGWRSGGFVRGNVEEETLNAIEVGFKGTFLDNRLRASLAGFFYDYDDMQLVLFANIAQPGSPPDIVGQGKNAGVAEVQGMELELLAKPTPALTLSFVGGLTKAKYVKFDDLDPVTGALLDRSGLDFVNTPEVTYTVSGSYAIPIAGIGELVPNIAYNWVDSYFSDIPNNPEIKTKAHSLLSARVPLLLNDGKTEIALFGRNLLNTNYITGGANISLATWRFWNEPRTYGIEIRHSI